MSGREQVQDRLARTRPASTRRLRSRGQRGSWELTLDLLDARPLPEARQVLRLLACLADAPLPYQLLLHPGTLRGKHLVIQPAQRGRGSTGQDDIIRRVAIE